LAVGCQVGQVIDDIDSTRQQAEQCEACQGVSKRGGVRQLPVEGDGDEQEHVFGPLLGAHRF
jgi:hypothetical protein